MGIVTGSNWPSINMQEINLDWIFNELIPRVEALRTSYDNIQSTVERITQENYTEWRGELAAELSRLRTKLTADNAAWQEQFTAGNIEWQTGVMQTMLRKFDSWSQAQQQALEVWEHDSYNRLTQLVNSFAEDISAAEARAKEYADKLDNAQAIYINNQIHMVQDTIAHMNSELSANITQLQNNLSTLRADMENADQAIRDEVAKHKEDVSEDIAQFREDVQEQIATHQESVARQLIQMQNIINEQVRLIHQRISKLTAADIDAVNPRNNEHDNVQNILRQFFNLLDEVRGTISAAEYAQLGLTAAEYKKHNYKAIIYSCFSFWLLKIRNWYAPAIQYSGDYVRPEELENRLQQAFEDFASKEDLSDLVDSADLREALNNYLTREQTLSYIASTLENYTTFDDVRSMIDGFATPEDIERLTTLIEQKASQQSLEELRQSVYDEFGNYVQIKDLPDFSEFAKSADVAATYETIEGAAATYQPKGDYATQQDVTDAIEAIPEVDLTPYETKENAAATYQPKGDYATQQDVTDAIEAIPEVDLTPYETKENAAATYQPKGDYIDRETLDTTLVPYIQQAEAAGMFEKKTEASAAHQTINEQIQQLAVMFNSYLQKNSLKNTLFHANPTAVGGVFHNRKVTISAPAFDVYLTTINGTAINAALPGGRVDEPVILEYTLSVNGTFGATVGFAFTINTTDVFQWAPLQKTIFSTGYAHASTYGLLYRGTQFLGTCVIIYEFSSNGYRIYGTCHMAIETVITPEAMTLKIFAGERAGAALVQEEENV